VTLRFRIALATFAAAFPAGALAARALLAHAPAAIAVDRAQPLVVVTSWGAFGGAAFAALAAAVAVAAVALAIVLHEAPPGAAARGTAVAFALAAAGIAGAACFPFTFSSDPYAYAAYGAMAARGIDPYALVPASLHGAPFDAARWQWGGVYPVCVYGPAFVAFARALDATAGPFGLAAELAAFRLSAALAFLGSIALLGDALRALAPRTRFRVLCAYGGHPVLLWSVAEGHNDAFVLLAAAAAAVLARRGAAFGAGLLVAASAAFKATGAALAAVYALDAAFVRRTGRRAAAGVAAGLALAAALTLPPMRPALAALGAHGRYAPSVSLQTLLGLGPSLALAAAAAAFGIIRVVRSRERDGFAWLGLAAVAALPNLYPWYGLWLVPLALAAGPGGASLALYGVTICAVIRYLPDAAGNMTLGMVRSAAVAALSPLVAAFAALRLPKKAVAHP
jgi:hypothetical protein